MTSALVRSPSWPDTNKAQANVPLFFSFLFKLKLTANVKRAIAAIPWDTWQGRSNEGLVQLAELDLKLTGWSRSRRVIVERTLKPLNPSPQ